jgi:uncharacterized DUF497 family protein
LVEFEWDARKARSNAAKHGITFEEATTVFGDPLALTVPDERFDEERWWTIGRSERRRTIVVAHFDQGGRVRIISARTATTRERKNYEQS